MESILDTGIYEAELCFPPPFTGEDGEGFFVPLVDPRMMRPERRTVKGYTLSEEEKQAITDSLKLGVWEDLKHLPKFTPVYGDPRCLKCTRIMVLVEDVLRIYIRRTPFQMGIDAVKLGANYARFSIFLKHLLGAISQVPNLNVFIVGRSGAGKSVMMWAFLLEALKMREMAPRIIYVESIPELQFHVSEAFGPNAQIYTLLPIGAGLYENRQAYAETILSTAILVARTTNPDMVVFQEVHAQAGHGLVSNQAVTQLLTSGVPVVTTLHYPPTSPTNLVNYLKEHYSSGAVSNSIQITLGESRLGIYYTPDPHTVITILEKEMASPIPSITEASHHLVPQAIRDAIMAWLDKG